MKPGYFFVMTALLFSCKRPWTDKDRQAFLGGCVNKAVPEMGEEKARSYCSCMLRQLETHYPNANDLKYLKSDTTVYSLARECR